MSTNFKLNMVSPCHKNWDKMSVTQKGRYCNACKKEVLDLTNVDDKDLPTYLAGVTNFCGRIQPHRLNSITNTHKRFSFKKIAASVIMGLGLNALFPKYSNAQTMTAVYFHIGNTIRPSLTTNQPNVYISTGCQTGSNGDSKAYDSFAQNLIDFSGNYYLRAPLASFTPSIDNTLQGAPK